MWQVPTEQEVEAFLDACRTTARSAMELHVATLRSVAASSLGIDTYELDETFACTNANPRIKALQDAARRVWQENQARQQEVASVVQGVVDSAKGALADSRALEDEVARLSTQSKFVGAVPQDVADFVVGGDGVAQHSGAPAHLQPFAFTVHAPGEDGRLRSGGGVVGVGGDRLQRGSRIRANLVALMRMLHAHVVERDVAGDSMVEDEGPGGSASSVSSCPRSIPAR